ncbi:MAG: cyclase family protein [Lewinellaceae bacterium]|nr:cyclase family protein [Saprospiraceae bacterium]MCB9333906.1 cyclase family protein [Lewinellaceae bacterium]
MKKHRQLNLQTVFIILTIVFNSCNTDSTSNNRGTAVSGCKEIVDLGMLITEDLPERIIGKAAMDHMGWEKNNEFDVRHWEFPTGDADTIKGSDTYFTLFNHAGTHVDAPNHMNAGGGIDSYPLDAFIGPVKVFDVSAYSEEHPVPKTVFENKVSAGDIVIAFVNYNPAQPRHENPGFSTHLSEEAAEFLAGLPVRAFGTDAASAGASHPAFLPRKIPIYEQLINVDKLLGKDNMLFIGVPINIQNADGSFVRPVVMVY